MPRVTVTPQTPIGPYPTLPIAANALDITFTPADSTNFNQFPYTGKEVLIARNTGATVRNVTITSVADDLRRTGDIGPYALQAGDFMAFNLNQLAGWRQTDGMLYFQADNAEVTFAVLRIG